MSRRLLPLLAPWLFACATTSGAREFGYAFADNDRAAIERVVQRLDDRASYARISPRVVIIPPLPEIGLSVRSIPEGGTLWTSTVRAQTRPYFAGRFVVAQANHAILGWDIETGNELWRLPDHDWALLGADGDETGVALALGPGGRTRRQGLFLLLDGTSGQPRTAIETGQALGRPAVATGLAFVPWGGQYLSVFDAQRGQEIARLRSRDDLFGVATATAPTVFYGSAAVYRLLPASALGTRDAASAWLPSRTDLPGNPPPFVDGYEPRPAGLDARDRVAVVWRPEPLATGVRFTDGLYYALFHRVVFAVDQADGTVRWAHTLPVDLAGAQSVRGGIVVVDENGDVRWLDARDGHQGWRLPLEAPAAQAVLSLPIEFEPPDETGAEGSISRAASLVRAAGGTDDRLLPARIFAASALARVPGEEATRGLLDITSRASNPPELRAAAAQSLASRSDGLDLLLDALAVHEDYLSQTQSPPVGAIARAFAAAHDRRAVPALLTHLQDPATPAAELAPLCAALRDLADPAAVPVLLEFVRLHHSDDGPLPPVTGGEPINDRSLTEQEALTAALELAIDAVAHAGSPTDRRWLEFLRDDPNTLEPVRQALVRALAGPGAPATPGRLPDGRISVEIAVARLTPEMIADAFLPVRIPMLHCLDGLESRPAQVRLQFRYDGTGRITEVTATPRHVEPCLVPFALGVTLPESQTNGDIGTYYLVGGPR